MSHNPLSSSQAQAMVMSSGAQAGQPMQQRTMIAQRGSPSVVAKAGYPSPMTHQYMQQQAHHHQQQQQQQAQQQAGPPPQLMATAAATAVTAGYHKQKQMSPDLGHQFATTMSLPAQNGAYQTNPASSMHSALEYDSSQLNLQYHQQSQQQQLQQQQQQQQQQQPHQHHQYAMQQQQAYRQQAYQQTHHQHQHEQIILNHHQQKQQQQQQIQLQQLPQQQQQQQQQQQSLQQQLQIQQHLQQRSLNQQQRYQQKQMQQQQQASQGNPISQQQQQQQQLPPSSSGVETVESASVSNGHPLTSGVVAPLVFEGVTDTDEGSADEKAEITDSCPSVSDQECSNKPTSDDSSNASEKHTMANTKEKTPMCLINELARFNKMSHQYILVDEQGPAHKKTFYVKLKLGDEEYSASGESIKKAQHASAAIALSETKHQHPPPKTAPQLRGGMDALDKDGNLTPTVELNALAMKRGEATYYKSIEPQQPFYYHQQQMEYRGLYNPRYNQYMRGVRDPRYNRGGGNGGGMWPVRYHYPRPNRAFYVSLRVGHREFIGDGPTRQAARHNAAQKAMRILKNLPITNDMKKQEEEVEQNGIDDSLKSEISLVHEIALRKNMNVLFTVIRETGPPHMKHFVCRCTVAHLTTEGEGNSKKMAKKKAAEQMLEELQKLPPSPAPACPRPKVKTQMNKKKNRNIIKSELQQQKADPNYGVGINPISRLIQIMQAQKKKEPVYTLVAERGLPRRREFIVTVEVEGKMCTGSGPNKKLAKRAAAEDMLQLLGYTKPSPQPTKSSFKNSSSESGNSNGDKKMVTFVEGDSHKAGGDDQPSPGPSQQHQHQQQQRVPGLLHLPTKSSISSTAGSSKEVNLVNLSNILKPNLRPELQLKELCKAISCQLEIDDFTKKRPSGTEHITRITVGSDNPQSFHGSNTSLESSRDMAALDALKVLLAKVKDVHPAGDGPQMKKELLVRANTSSTSSSSSSGPKNEVSS